MSRFASSLTVVLLAASAAIAQGPEGAKPGFTWYESFQGSFNSLGAVTRLDSTAGYNFGAHFSVDFGLPVYFVRPSNSTSAATGTQAVNGIGNVYTQLRLSLPGEAVSFVSTLTATAPTGNKADGLSTGHATVDWSNDFAHSFGRFTPFAGIGFANSVSDSLFFVRPYTTSGFVAHVQGGGRYQLAKMVTAGASVYDIAPAGQQTVISRLFKGASKAATTSKGNQGVFRTAASTTGSSAIAQDHGFSTWVRLGPVSCLDFSAGYTRSAQYALNTVFFGVGVSLDKALHQTK